MVLLLAACSAPHVAAKPTPTGIEVSGTVGVPPYGLFTGAAGGVNAEGDPCHADDGYDDIAEGAQVTVSDAAGKTIAIGTLTAATFTNGSCTFPFTVDDVPTSSKFYGVHVGNTNRGVLQYTLDQLKSGPHLTIGS